MERDQRDRALRLLYLAQLGSLVTILIGTFMIVYFALKTFEVV